MKSIRHFAIIIFLSALTLFAGCLSTSAHHEKVPPYTKIYMEENYTYIQSDFLYPQFKSAEYDTLNKGIKGFVEDNYKHFKKDIKSNYEYALKENPKALPGWYSLRAERITQSATLTSILFQCAFYQPGTTHGNTLFKSINYDIAKKRPVSITEATGLTEEYISKSVRKELSHLEKEGFLISGTEPGKGHFNNYTLDGKTLTIYFAPYEVAPYTSGCQSVTIDLN